MLTLSSVNSPLVWFPHNEGKKSYKAQCFRKHLKQDSKGFPNTRVKNNFDGRLALMPI